MHAHIHPAISIFKGSPRKLDLQTDFSKFLEVCWGQSSFPLALGFREKSFSLLWQPFCLTRDLLQTHHILPGMKFFTNPRCKHTTIAYWVFPIKASNFSRCSASHCSRLSRWMACCNYLLNPTGSVPGRNGFQSPFAEALSESIWPSPSTSASRQRIWPTQGDMSSRNTVLWASSCFYLPSTCTVAGLHSWGLLFTLHLHHTFCHVTEEGILSCPDREVGLY